MARPVPRRAALFALLMATGAGGPVPPIHALGLLEALSIRYLDLIANQIDAIAATSAAAGRFTPAQLDHLKAIVASAVDALRTTGSLPPALPQGSSILTPASATFYVQADRSDPGQLAAHLTGQLPVLVTCSDADTQVSRTDVNHLMAGLTQAPAATDFVHLTGVDHVLKKDPSSDAANYGEPLPFSAQLRDELRAFASRNL